MRVLSDEHLKARACLAAGSFLIDPRYQFPTAKYEGMLKERCRVCWAMRKFFPSWVLAYVEQWSKQSGPVVSRDEEDWV